MKQSIAIAMSGGVDSTVAAYLLKKQGQDVFGIHFITGYNPVKEKGALSKNAADVSTAEKAILQNILPIAEHLDIPIEMVDIRAAFEKRVVEYFIRTYHAGQTPNPCMVCNPSIKFGTVFRAALNRGATAFATGHYARVSRDKAGRFRLLRGMDPEKEQSYFLAKLSQMQLSRALFPLAEMTKARVKQLAREQGFFPLVKEESQDVCFVRETTYAEFLKKKGGAGPKPGPIVDMDGNVIGEHRGLHGFTVGQRKGINCPAAEPYYVVRIDTVRNCLVVGHKQDLLSSECSVEDINWIIEAPQAPICVETRVRYRHKAAPSILFPIDAHRARVRFKTPQSAITPGQCAVFYQGDEVLGGGWIQGDQVNSLRSSRFPRENNGILK
jgi:tRNA-specific 2-thiouridylase